MHALPAPRHSSFLRRLACRAVTSTLVALAAWLALGTTAAMAEPYMALREGYTCGDCHTNRTGGGMRNLTAEIHAAEILRLPNDGDGVLPAHEQWFSPHINEYFSVGADFRLVEELTFADDPDADGKVENNTAFRELDRSDFDLDQGTLYSQLRLIPEMFSVYIDEQVAPGGARNREAFALLENVLPYDIYLKGGRFFPGFGLKLDDDRAFVSLASGFNFDRTLTGIEVGRSALGWNWAVSLSEGGENIDQLAMGSSYYIWAGPRPLNGLMIGGSAAHYEPEDLETSSFTAFGGASWSLLTVLAQGLYLDGEAIVTDTGGAEDVVDRNLWAAYIEANLLLLEWLNVKLAFDYMNPDDGIGEDEQNRVSVGIEPFLDRFLQLRMFYRVLNGPEDQPDTNRDQLTIEGHFFF